ncbi:MAG TPA: aspartate kinase [Oscillospiraceae bacterium]|nr:aspartate kinase [Oscillospiraceae bacterium]
MALIVQKFGGTSVADAAKLDHVAGVITRTYAAGNSVAVVVSAQGDTTDHLIEQAKEVNPSASKREMDVLLSAGEQMSMSLLAMAIEKRGYPVVSLTGWQVGMVTDSNYGIARIRRVDKEWLESELGKKNIVIVAGFQGINRYDDITTLGRGGSDTSAVALAAALHADLCQIYTDVDGIYTADPRIVPNARKLAEISYDEMLELSSLGAQVLNNRSVEMAKKYCVPLEVRSSMEDEKPGTILKEVVKVEKTLISGVTCDNNVARFSLIEVPDMPGIAFRIFSILAAKNINVDIILQSIGRGNTKDISFTVSGSQMKETLDAMPELVDLLHAQRFVCDENISKVSVVGAGMQSHPGVAAKMFEALADANINIQMIATSEIKISVLIGREEAIKAVNVIHEAFETAF